MLSIRLVLLHSCARSKPTRGGGARHEGGGGGRAGLGLRLGCLEGLGWNGLWGSS